mmetsp:Transcript_5405/g.7964  ORF Transcript_5405/g.7964 Transcript_5405/m.7964 type:complete len:509 (+) Transcript_5405:59-1585(+)
MEDYSLRPRVFDGAKWDLVDDRTKADREQGPQQVGKERQHPLPPMLDKDNGKIFVSIVSYRDGKRCGQTLKSLFEKASEPEKVFVGLVEQNKPEDAKCIRVFCNSDPVLCNKHSSQIRYLASFDLASQGPVQARALQRKNLADEEFCLQIDSHMDFIQGWDTALKEEWLGAQNEFAVISTMPPNMADRVKYEDGGDKVGQVPRLCHLERSYSNFPMFTKPPKEFAVNLKAPLLAHSWNAGFSFHKCHLEEIAPYDFFMPQVFDGEEFPRFARLWTRGYDVYTPSKNIVFHDEGPEPDGHDMKGWPKMEILRELSIHRLKTLLQMPAGDHSEVVQANFGLYGLGKRRSMEQFAEFIGVDFESTKLKISSCGKKQWVPYDFSVTAFENLYDHANDLDPQPEFPLRNRSQQPKISPDVSSSASFPNSEEIGTTANDRLLSNTPTANSGMSPFLTFLFWIFGIFMWYKVFAAPQKRHLINGLHTKGKAGRKTNGLGIGSLLNPSFTAGDKDA